MRKWIISSLIIVALASVSVSAYSLSNSKPAPATAPQVQSQTYKAPTVDELLTLVNAERAKNGVAPLQLDERLNQSAQRKADDMATYKYFNHVSPNDGKHGYEYINDVGITCKTDGENIHWGTEYYATSVGAMDGWLNSPPHHAAMISNRYILTGFGISSSGDVTYVAEHFCEQ